MSGQKFFLLVLLVSVLSCESDQSVQQIDQYIAAMQSEHIPDRRVDRFDVAVQEEGGVHHLVGETTRPELLAQLLQQLDSAGFSVQNEVLPLPDPQLGNQTWGLIRLSVANLRSKPQHSAELSSQLLMGMPIRVLKQEEDWFFIQGPDQYLGWLDREAFVQLDQAGLEAWQALPKAIITRPEVVIRDSLGLYPVTDLVAGNIIALTEKPSALPGTQAVLLPDGRGGIASPVELIKFDQWLDLVQTPNRGLRMAMAQSFLGRPYLWGGTSAKGFDCSGFTKTVYYLQGMIIPRDASQQVRVGKEIETDTTWSNLQLGDLLFFGRKATETQKERITHVAFYLGDGKILHATGRVKIESLRREDPDFAEHRFDTFVRAKRLDANAPGILSLKDMPWFGI